METAIQILHLEDDPTDAEFVQAILAEAGLACRIVRAQTLAEFETGLRDGGLDIILADYRLPAYDGMSALRLAHEHCPEIPFIFVSGTMGEEAAIEALTQGATDYVLKQNLSRLPSAVKRALREARNRDERQQAQKALAQSEAKMRSILNNIVIGVSLISPKMEILELNKRMHQWFPGIDPNQRPICYQAFNTPPCQEVCSYCPTCKTLQDGLIHETTTQTLQGGEIRNYRIISTPLLNAVGEVVAAIAMFDDITQRRQAEQQVALMSFALDGIHEAAFIIDENAGFRYVNDEACRILGYSRDELLTMGVPDINPDLSMEHWPGHWNDLKQRGALVFEGVLKTRDGRLIPVEISANYFEFEGQSFGLRLVRDITERKQVERERLANLRFFESMDKVNRAIQGANDLEIMMKVLLDVVLSIFDCDRAFLMYPCDPESPTWTSPMECSKPEYPGVWDLKQEMPMDPQVAETLRILLAADGPVAFGPGTPHALPEEVSKQFGFKCFMSMAIYPKQGSPWQFGIYQCTHARVWTTEEMRMLEAIGRRLADSLSSLLSYRDLRKNEEFLDNVVEHIPNMIFVKDAQTLRFVRFNKAGERLLGYPREELLGKTDYDFFPREEADFFAAKDHQVLGSKELVDIPEETIRNRSNEERILHTQKIPLLDDAGTPQFLLGISEDITERKQAEASISKLSQAIEQSPVSIVITDIAGKIEFVNARFTQVTGYTYAEVIGQNPRILKSGETPAEDYERLWKTISSGGVWQGEFRNRKRNGELFREQATIAPVRNADNAITHYVAVKEDITERKELEEHLRQSQKMEAVGQLAGGVAHDFNNMLGVIIGYTEMILDQEDLDDSLRQYLNQILAAGHRSAEITRQLLAFARKQTVVPKILDLNKTVEGMLKLLRRLIGEDIELAWLPGAKLWPVKIDPSQIDQILANLCVNARDAIAGVGKVTIETQIAVFDEAYCAEQRGFSPGEYAMLAVSDNGSGMDKPTMDKIFEPFFTTKPVGKGTGLGLATIYGIVKQNDGFVNVYSVPGHGSTFKVYLPRHTVAAGQEPEAQRTPSGLMGHETVLIVEDDISHLNMAKLILESYGYQVLAASTPGDALLVAREYREGVHLLLTDLVMPEMNGRELANRITALFPDILCLYMSGYTDDVIVDHGILEAGINFIQKPFSKQALAKKVREVLNR